MAIHLEAKKNNLVSIILSVYNAERYLKETIYSLLSQSYKKLEIIIINDGSKDLSRKIILEFNDKRIIFLDRKENWGLTKSLNQGLAIARGKYIARIDAGDISQQFRIEKQVEFLENNPDISVLGSGVEMFSRGKFVRRFIYSKNSKEIRQQLVHFINPIPHSTLMFRKEILDKLGGYNEFFVKSQDYDFLLRASENFQISSLPECLVKLRISSDSLSYADDEQLKFGIAALICGYRRLNGRLDYSFCNKKEELQVFWDRVELFIEKRHLNQKIKARKFLNLALFSLTDLNFFKCFMNLTEVLRNDALFFLKKSCYFNIPNDIDEFMG